MCKDVTKYENKDDLDEESARVGAGMGWTELDGGRRVTKMEVARTAETEVQV